MQAEEAQHLKRMRKREKAEAMRMLDMERRQKLRVEEMRKNQKKVCTCIFCFSSKNMIIFLLATHLPINFQYIQMFFYVYCRMRRICI